MDLIRLMVLYFWVRLHYSEKKVQFFGNNFCVFDLRLVKPYTAGRGWYWVCQKKS